MSKKQIETAKNEVWKQAEQAKDAHENATIIWVFYSGPGIMLNSNSAIPIPGADPENYVDIEGWARKMSDLDNTITYSLFDCSREVWRSDCILHKNDDPVLEDAELHSLPEESDEDIQRKAKYMAALRSE